MVISIIVADRYKGRRVKTSLEVAGSERRLATDTEVALFRITQEALHNVEKHSKATEAAIRLKFTQKKVRLTVFDNGRGFESPHN
ncbi:unnamed protein product, partial [marine sediment metagenome]